MSRPVVCKLGHYGLLRFSGTDAQAFLHNQLTCDVTGLPPDQRTYGAYCTAKGRALAIFLLWRTGQDYFMQLPSPLLEPIRKQLAKFVLRSKVTIADASGDWVQIGVAGDGALALLERAAGHSAGCMTIRLPGDRCLLVAATDRAPRLIESLAAEAQEKGPDYWDWLEIRAGIPVVTAATQEAFVPQMLNLDLIGGVSFDKGCYPGQEIVARMHYRGTLKQRMYLAHVAGTEKPQAGDKLYSPAFGEQASGTIVNSAQAPGGGFDVLAAIQTAGAGKGGVRWNSPDGPAIEFQALPYPLPA